MSDGITVSGGGSIAVDTAEMQAAAAWVNRIRESVAAVLAAVVAELADPLWVSLRAPGRAPADDACRAAMDLLHGAVAQAEAAEHGLRIAALRYGAAEEVAARGINALSAGTGAALGASLRIGSPAPGILVATLGLPAGVLVAGRIAIRTAETGRFAPQADPVLLGAAQLLIGASDDVLRGHLGVEMPWNVLEQDPDSFLGTASIAAFAGTALGVLFSSGGRIHVERRGTTIGPGPRSLDDLVTRLPDGSGHRPQVSVTRVVEPDGSFRWIVSAAGTVTFDPRSGTEPNDMQANLRSVGDATSLPEVAVLDAMRQAGVQDGDSVLFVGHSQGGIVAERLAATGRWDAAVFDLAGPAGQVTLPDDVPVLAIEQYEDLVPRLGGPAALGVAGARRVLVRRSVDPREPAGTRGPFYAHQLDTCRETVRLVEDSPEPRLVEVRRRLAPFLSGGTATTTTYRADRVPSAPEIAMTPLPGTPRASGLPSVPPDPIARRGRLPSGDGLLLRPPVPIPFTASR